MCESYKAVVNFQDFISAIQIERQFIAIDHGVKRTFFVGMGADVFDPIETSFFARVRVF